MSRHIRAALLPSDHSSPHLIAIKTILLEPNAPNSTLGHHPDFRKYWGGAKGWEWRLATTYVVEGEEGDGEELNGKYWLWRCLAEGRLGGNKWVGECMVSELRLFWDGDGDEGCVVKHYYSSVDG